jgi:hypothetical protein
MQTKETVAVLDAPRHSPPWRQLAGSGIGESKHLIN